jgi:hypothetical protein
MNQLIQTKYNQNYTVNWEWLLSLPSNTLRHQFAKFMQGSSVTPFEKLPEPILVGGILILPKSWPRLALMLTISSTVSIMLFCFLYPLEFGFQGSG